MKYTVLVDNKGIIWLNDEIVGYTDAGRGKLIFDTRDEALEIIHALNTSK